LGVQKLILQWAKRLSHDGGCEVTDARQEKLRKRNGNFFATRLYSKRAPATGASERRVFGTEIVQAAAPEIIVSGGTA
jgi:hypothetical protein